MGRQSDENSRVKQRAGTAVALQLSERRAIVRGKTHRVARLVLPAEPHLWRALAQRLCHTLMILRPHPCHIARQYQPAMPVRGGPHASGNAFTAAGAGNRAARHTALLCQLLKGMIVRSVHKQKRQTAALRLLQRQLQQRLRHAIIVRIRRQQFMSGTAGLTKAAAETGSKDKNAWRLHTRIASESWGAQYGAPRPG